MCCKLFIALAFAMISVVLIDGQKEPSDVVSVRSIDQKLETALSTNDTGALDQIVADDYLEINAQGEISDRAKLLSTARTRKTTPASHSVGPERTVSKHTFRMHGDTAIGVSTISTRHQFMEYQTSGTPPSQRPETVDEEWQMRVYARTGSTWRLVAQQTTAIPKR